MRSILVKMKQFLAAICVMAVSACSGMPRVVETEMPATVIQAIDFTKAFFKPGEPATWTVRLSSDGPVAVVLVTTVRFLDEVCQSNRQTVSFGPGAYSLQSSWTPPAEAPRGYGLDVRLETPDGREVAYRAAAFDVLDRWTQNPRYGFLVDFSPGRATGPQTLDTLLRFHINGLQFYDWMYRHDEYLPPQDPYLDPLGRPESLETVKSLIEAAHARGMAAMPYTAVYAASVPFFNEHKAWALYQADGTPVFFGDNFLVIMDPRPTSAWTRHLLGQFTRILSQTKFDGIHLDQYGDPKTGYDAQGNFFRLEEPLAQMIDATKDLVTAARGDQGAVIFNAVTNWPIETVAPSKEDVVYIEVWPPYTSFGELGSLVRQAQKLGGGKPVVLAAYIDPRYTTNVLLNDATIFANGAGHIELGEQGDYLADAYFPRYKVPSAELAAALQRFYEFAIRYQNVIGPQTHSADRDYVGKVSLGAGIETTAGLTHDVVMTAVREGGGYTAVSLINLLGLDSGEWATGTLEDPTPLGDTKVSINGVTRGVAQVWFASPDGLDPALRPLDFHQSGELLMLTIPSLRFWDLVLIKWST